MTKEFFRALPSGELQQQVFSKLLDFALIDDDADDVQAFKNVLLKVEKSKSNSFFDTILFYRFPLRRRTLYTNCEKSRRKHRLKERPQND